MLLFCRSHAVATRPQLDGEYSVVDDVVEEDGSEITEEEQRKRNLEDEKFMMLSQVRRI